MNANEETRQIQIKHCLVLSLIHMRKQQQISSQNFALMTRKSVANTSVKAMSRLNLNSSFQGMESHFMSLANIRDGALKK